MVALRDKEIQAKDEYWTTQVDIQRQAAEAWMLWAQGRKDAALKAMAAAAALEDTTEKSAVTPGPLAPAHELLGEMLLEAKQPAEALKEFETGLEERTEPLPLGLRRRAGRRNWLGQHAEGAAPTTRSS